MALPAVLIGWNTFATRLVFALALPVLVLAPLTLWLTCPSIRRHFLAGVEGNPVDSFSADEDFDRGEVFLLKRPEEAKTQVFKAHCKFMCLAVRIHKFNILTRLVRMHILFAS